MSFFDSVVRGAVGISTGGLSEVYRYSKNKTEKEKQDAMANSNAISNERRSLLQEGLEAGRAKGEELTGQSSQQTGEDVQNVIGRRREMMDAPSRAESAIRSGGQNTARRARSAGASDAQQRQVRLETEQAAGLQGDIDRERRLQHFQGLLGNVMATQSALEPGYGQLFLSSQHIAPESRDPGLLGTLFNGLGL